MALKRVCTVDVLLFGGRPLFLLFFSSRRPTIPSTLGMVTRAQTPRDRLLRSERSVVDAEATLFDAGATLPKRQRCAEKMRVHTALPAASSFGALQRHQYERVPFSFLLVFQRAQFVNVCLLENKRLAVSSSSFAGFSLRHAVYC